MLFCPSCANMLVISDETTGRNKWICQTCPYEFPIKQTMKSRTHLKRKEVDDVLGGDESWGNQTNGMSIIVHHSHTEPPLAPCPKCENPMAHFMELQIRSADEPMTIFYKCTRKECGFQWKDN